MKSKWRDKQAYDSELKGTSSLSRSENQTVLRFLITIGFGLFLGMSFMFFFSSSKTGDDEVEGAKDEIINTLSAHLATSNGVIKAVKSECDIILSEKGDNWSNYRLCKRIYEKFPEQF